MEKNFCLLEALVPYTVPELCDGMKEFRIMDWNIKPWIGRKKIVGYALTVDVPSGEGAKVVEAIEKGEKGDVIVIAGKGNCGLSYWGDHRSLCARQKGIEGVVIDGAFRDLEGCEEEEFPIYAKALTCRTAGKTGEGEIGVPVVCGGVSVYPGDIIVADVNGVCVIRPEEVFGILERTKQKVEAERYTRMEMERTGTVIPRVIKTMQV